MRLPRPLGWQHPPRLLVAASLLVLAVCTVLAVLGAVRTGITTDEPIHVMRLRNYFDTGWYALDWDYSGSGPGSDGTNTFVYAPVTMLLLHAWSVLCGAEGWHEVATSPHAYDVRHLGVVVIGLVCLVAVAAIGRVLLGSWRWGVVAAAVLAAIPMWTGHEMFNVKDVPVATGYTLVTLGLLCLVREHPPRWPLRLARAGCLVAGLVLTLGTRPGMWSGIAAVVVIALIGIRFVLQRRAAIIALMELALAGTVAAAALVLIYPHLFGHPLHALPRTTESSSSFLDGLRSDRLYVPRHVAEEVPTLLLVFVLTGAVVGVLVIWRQWRWRPVAAARIALVGVQASALPVVAILMGSDLYHGLRQLLFAAPASAVLATYGMAWWLDQPRPRVRLVALAAATAGLLLPVVDQVSLQPYQTTYVNLATDLVTGPSVAPANRPGGDFWRVSLPDLIDGVPLDRQLLCKSLVDEATGTAYRFTNGGVYSTTRSLDCREEANGPLAPERLPIDRSAPGTEFDAVYLGVLPPNCTKRNEVTRWRHGFEVVLTVLGRCTTEPADLGADEIRGDDPALGTALDGDLWRYAVNGWESWPRRTGLVSPVPRATLAFRPATSCDAGCTLVIEGRAPADLRAWIGGGRVPVRRAPDGTLQVSLDADQASVPDGVWVSFDRPAGAPLGFELTGISLAGPLLIQLPEGQQ